MAELPPPDVSADQARDTADQVLSGRAYLEASRPPSLRERLFDWVGDRFSDLFNSLSSVGERGIIAWVIIGAFVALIIFLLVKLARGFGPIPERAPDPDPTIDIAGESSADEWLRQAVDAEARGDWRSGIRSRHRALVLRMVDADVVRLRAGQTAGEIATAVAAARPAAGEAIHEATYLFKDVWYGWVEAGEAERDRFAQLSDQITATELVTT